MAKNIILLGLDFRDDITQESSIIMIIVDAMVIAKDTVGIVNNNCADIVM